MEENEVKQENIEEINEENSGIKISNDVVAVIAGVAVSEVRGVASMQGILCIVYKRKKRKVSLFHQNC